MKIGDKIGKLTLLEKIGRGYHKDAMWKCQCDCGNIFYRYTSSVKKGKSCGCDKYEDLTGKKFGRLTVIKRVQNSKNQKSRWLCKCDCGNEVVVERSNLSINKTKTISCGCWKKEKITKHNKHKTNIYFIYTSMKQRCYNPKNPAYKYYGLKGIKICDDWLENFMNFYNWAMSNQYKEGLSIDRINVNGDYEPNNCRWVNSLIQMNNTTRNHYITYKNEKHTIAEWARKYNIKYSTFYQQIKKGKAIEEIVKTRKENII